MLVGVVQRDLHLLGTSREDALHEGLVDAVHLNDLRRDVELGEELHLHVAEGAYGLLGEHERGEHVLFGDLLRAGLEHVDGVLGTGDHQVEIGILGLIEARVDQELAGLHVAADAHAGQRALEGQAGGHEGRAGAHDRDDVGLVDLVGREHGRDDLDLVAEPVGKRAADRAVDHASGQRCLLGRARLALDEAAGELARGVHALFEIHRQREEVQILRELRRGGGDEHDGLALTNQDGAAGLLGQLPGLEHVLLAVKLKRFHYLSHKASLFFPLPHRAPHAPRLIVSPLVALPAHPGSVNPYRTGRRRETFRRRQNKKAGCDPRLQVSTGCYPRICKSAMTLRYLSMSLFLR